MSIAGAVGAGGTVSQIDEYADLFSAHSQLFDGETLEGTMVGVACQAAYHGNWENAKYVLHNYTIDGPALVYQASLAYDSKSNALELLRLVISEIEVDTFAMALQLIHRGDLMDTFEKYLPETFDLPDSDRILLVRAVSVDGRNRFMAEKRCLDLIDALLSRVECSMSTYGPATCFTNCELVHTEDARASSQPLLHLVIARRNNAVIERVLRYCPEDARRELFEGDTPLEFYRRITPRVSARTPQIEAMLSTHVKGAIE